MRCAAAFLLLLLLPGLILPAGMLLHVCRCAPRASAETRSCCATEKQPERPACCRAHRGERPRAPASDEPRFEARCGCTWVPMPEPRFEPFVPDLATIAAPARASHSVPIVVDWTHCPPPRAWPTADCRPPPPHRERNLPLRV